MRCATGRNAANLVGASLVAVTVVWAAPFWVRPPSAAAQEPPRNELEAVAAKVAAGDLVTAERELREILSRPDTQSQSQSQSQSERPGARDLLARILLRQGRAEEALTELRAASTRKPLERDLGLWLAEMELARGEEAAAEAQLVSLVERYDSVRALMHLARLQGRRGDHRIAAETIRRAVALAPNSEEVLAGQAKVSLAGRAPVVAIQTLDALTRMHPTVAEYRYLLGVARLQIGDLAGAIDALQRSLELEPDRALALIALGSTLSSQKRFEEARDVLRKGLQLDPGNVEALAALSEAEEGLGDLEAAEEHAALALGRQNDHARALVTIGLIRMTQQRYEEARDVLVRAVQSAPDMSKAHYQLSLALARLGEREASSRHLELYRKARRESDERLIELRTRAGLPPPGMQP